MTVNPVKEPKRFAIRPLASGPDPRVQALLRRLGQRSVCPADCWRGGLAPGEAESRYAWAVALESSEEVEGAAWSEWPGREGDPPRLMVVGSEHSIGEEGLSALLLAAHNSARQAGQKQLWICVRQDQPSLVPLLESAGFRVYSSYGFGGVTEVTLDVLPEA